MQIGIQILNLIFINFEQFQMDYQKNFGIQDNRTPLQCRNGPLQQRKCTDVVCCLIYLLLIGVVVAFAILSANAMTLPRSQIEAEVEKSQIGGPFIALAESFFPILLAVLCVIALCLIMVITTFIIPSLAAYIYIPLALLMMLLIGSVFVFIYFGNTLPFIDTKDQDRYIEKNSLLALGIGIGFLAAFFLSIFVICSKKQKFKNIVPVLAIAKVCFWQNFYMIFISIILSIMSVVLLYLNVFFLEISQDKKDSQHYIPTWVMSLIIVIEMIWTHGFMEALSDFLFQSIAIHWYFNKQKYGEDYSKCGKNCSASCGLLFKHIGTIVFGHIMAYFPEEFNTALRRFEQGCTSCYNVCCFCHKITLRTLTKYSYSQTILQSHGFIESNREMFELKRRTKSTLPELYMMGNFYMTLSKILILMFSLTVVYFLLIQQNEHYYFDNIINLIVPLLVTLMVSSEICNHFMNATGLVGDTIVFMYTVDIEIEKKNFGETEPYSCPEKVREIIRQSRINQDGNYQF